MTGGRTDRRDLLKKGAIGGAVAWTAPMVLSVPAASAATVAPGCEIIPTSVGFDCGPSFYEIGTTFDAAACPGSIMQVDAFGGFPLIDFCDPIETASINTFSQLATVNIFTVTLRETCNGAILAGPQDIVVDTIAVCTPPPGNEAGAPVDPGEAAATVTVTMGDKTITVPAS